MHTHAHTYICTLCTKGHTYICEIFRYCNTHVHVLLFTHQRYSGNNNRQTAVINDSPPWQLNKTRLYTRGSPALAYHRVAPAGTNGLRTVQGIRNTGKCVVSFQTKLTRAWLLTLRTQKAGSIPAARFHGNMGRYRPHTQTGENTMTEKRFFEGYAIRFTNHSGKMDGIRSLSTSVVLNAICQARAKVAGSICSKCYAHNLVQFRRTLARSLERNHKALTKAVIDEQLWPVIVDRVFRLEAFGDLNNTIQVMNYFNFCKRNPETRFALWTKNPWIINLVVRAGYKKPENLNIIQSSKHINIVDAPAFDFIDAVFTVFDDAYIAEHNIVINCGALRCLSCLKCYKKHNGVLYINEKLK